MIKTISDSQGLHLWCLYLDHSLLTPSWRATCLKLLEQRTLVISPYSCLAHPAPEGKSCDTSSYFSSKIFEKPKMELCRHNTAA